MKKDEKNSCLVCHFPRTQFIRLALRNGQYLKCGHCGTLFRDFETFENEKSQMVAHYDRIDLDEKISESRKALFKHILAVLGNPESEGKLLDVGCGRGAFLQAAVEKKWMVCGTDISLSLCEETQNKLNIKVHCGDVGSGGFEDNSFQAITVTDTLYLLPNPGKTLQEIARILKPDGVLYMRVKNVKFHLFLDRIYSRLSGLLKPFIHRNPAVFHPINFTGKSLALLLEKNGFSRFTIKDSFLTQGDPYGTGSSFMVRLAKTVFNLFIKSMQIISRNRLFISPSLEVVARKDAA